MKKILLLLGILSFISCAIKNIPLNELGNLKQVKLYKTSNDYVENETIEVNAGIMIKEESEQHVTINGIYDIKTGQPIKKGFSAWALKYNDGIYFNLGYSRDLNNWGSYAKFDIEGKYCVVTIDDNSPNILMTTSINYGGGLTGVLIGESLKWGKNWKDKNGIKKKIFFIDTQSLSAKMFSRYASSHGNYLTRDQFKKILTELKITMTNKEIKNLEFQKVIEIIELANKNRDLP